MLAFYAKSLPDIKRQPCRKHHISLALPIHSRTASAMHPIPHPQSPPNHGEYVNDTWPNNHLQSAQSIRRPTWSLPHHWSPITSRRSPSPSHDAPTPSSFLPLLWLAFLSSFFSFIFHLSIFSSDGGNCKNRPTQSTRPPPSSSTSISIRWPCPYRLSRSATGVHYCPIFGSTAWQCSILVISYSLCTSPDDSRRPMAQHGRRIPLFSLTRPTFYFCKRAVSS